MDKIINLSLTTKHVPQRFDWVQNATKPNIVFVLDDYIPGNGARATLYIEKPSGSIIYNSASIENNRITYIPTKQSFAEVGESRCELQIVESDGTALSFLIFATIQGNIINAQKVRSTDEYGELVQLIQDAEQYENVIGYNNLTGANDRQYWTNLQAGDDLDLITELGVYSANNPTAPQILNKPPVNVAFKLIVASTTNSNGYLRQRVIHYNQDREWTRTTLNNGGTWTEWQEVPRRSEVESITTDLAPLATGRTAFESNNIVGSDNRRYWIALASEQNLNSVTDRGIYQSPNATVTDSLLNCPVTGGAFKMTVEISGGNSNSNIRQTIIIPHTTSTSEGVPRIEYTWRRQSSDGGSTWTDWIIEPLRTEVNAIANLANKNLIPSKVNAVTDNRSVISQEDGSVIVTITSTISSSAVTALGSARLKAGTYKLTGSSQENPSLQLAKTVGGTLTTIGYDRGNGLLFTLTEDTDITLRVHIPAGQTAGEWTFYPMIRNASILDDSFIPYGKTNAELTEDIYGQSEDRIYISNIGDILSDDIESGKYYVVGATNTPTGSVGYLDVTRREGFNNLQIRTWRPYNSDRSYRNIRKNSAEWGGWIAEVLPSDIGTITTPNIIAGQSYIDLLTNAVRVKNGIVSGSILIVSTDGNVQSGTVVAKGLPAPTVETYVMGAYATGVGSNLERVFKVRTNGDLELVANSFTATYNVAIMLNYIAAQ